MSASFPSSGGVVGTPSTPSSATSGTPDSSSAAAAAAASAGASDRSYRQCLTVSLAALLTEVGFDAADPVAVESLTEMLQSFLCELGRSIHAFTELACRQTPLPADILLAMVEMGLSTRGLAEHAFRNGRRSLGTPSVAQPAKQTSILHTGDRKRHRPGGIVPENFVEFPDSHSYIRTPTHKQPVTDYESVREKASSQKRDVERALTRFIAKTGKTHSLFSTDDTNLFPLISCDRTLPDQPILPPYINALLFKDQLFEEDEREFMPKKKKEEVVSSSATKVETDDEDDDKKEGLLPATPSTSAASAAPACAVANDSKDDGDTIDNPYLRAVRVPRTHAFKRIL